MSEREHPRVALARRGVELEAQYPNPHNDDFWVAHPDYPVANWVWEVRNSETRLGYWEWCAKMEADAQESDDEHTR